MVDFAQTVNAPQASSMTPPKVDSSWISDLYNNFVNTGFDQQKKQLNQQSITQGDQQTQLNAQRIQQGQQQAQLARAFPNGLPIDQSTGQVDYRAVASTLAKFGDVGSAVSVMGQQPPPMSPLLSGGGAPQQQGGGQPAPQGQPMSLPAKPLPPPAANAPQGDAGQGTITSIVTDKLPSQNQTTGETIGKIAQTMGLDPNANLTPGQQRRAQGLLKQYAGDTAGISPGGGNLPPSAAAATPAPPPASPEPLSRPVLPSQGAPTGAGSLAPQPAAPAAPPVQAAPPAAGPAPQPPQQQQQQPQQPQGNPPGPIGPQVPLPKGFTDPQAAILALRSEAARIGQNPKGAAQAQALDNWASRIEESVKPIAMRPGETLLDPRTGQPVYQGNQPTLTPDAINAAAERYLETGQLPPNMGRGAQGSATMSAIQNHAAALANERGIDMATLPGKWQQFKAQQVAIQRFTSGKQGDTIKSFNVLVDHLDTLSEAATALNNGDNRLLNRFKQNWAANTGGTAPTNFDGVKALVGDEIVKAVVGGAGALADREEVKKDLDRASSPKQIAELVEKYKKLALGQLHGLQKQYETATGQKNFGDMLLPSTLAALGGNKGETKPGAGGKPAADGATVYTLPNGSKARVQEVE